MAGIRHRDRSGQACVAPIASDGRYVAPRKVIRGAKKTDRVSVDWAFGVLY